VSFDRVPGAVVDGPGLPVALTIRNDLSISNWPLHLAAWPIQSAEGSDGSRQRAAWMAGNDWFQIAIRPLRERSYWISQRRNIPMPEPLHYQPK